MRFNDMIKGLKEIKKSNKYSFCIYENQISIYSNNLELLWTNNSLGEIDCCLSHNEDKVAFCSLYNYFYILDLNSFALSEKIILSDYDFCMGNGLLSWSNDDKYLYIPVPVDKKGDVLSVLLTYSLSEMKVVNTDNLCERYFIADSSSGIYNEMNVFAAYDRKEKNDVCSLLLCKNTKITDVINLKSVKGAIFKIAINEQGNFIIYTSHSIYFYNIKTNEVKSADELIKVKKLKKRYDYFCCYQDINDGVILCNYFGKEMYVLSKDLSLVKMKKTYDESIQDILLFDSSTILVTTLSHVFACKLH